MKVKFLFISLMILLIPASIWAKSSAPEQVDGAVTVSTERAKELMELGVAFIDVRGATGYQKSHIQKARHLDLKLDLTEAALLLIVKKHQPVVFYCNGDMCQRSAKASEKAVAWGWTTVYYYRGGYPDWQKAGLPLE